MPGIEPGPPGWKPGILATRPHGIFMFPPGIEPGTFRVLGGCDNHYTTETVVLEYYAQLNSIPQSIIWHSVQGILELLMPLFVQPSIAQLVERWTVVGSCQTSIGRWFKSGSKEFFFPFINIQGSLFTTTLYMHYRCFDFSLFSYSLFHDEVRTLERDLRAIPCRRYGIRRSGVSK